MHRLFATALKYAQRQDRFVSSSTNHESLTWHGHTTPTSVYYVRTISHISSSQLFLLAGEQSAASSRRSSVQPGRASADLDSLDTSQPPGHEGLASQGRRPIRGRRGYTPTNQRRGKCSPKYFTLLPPLAFLCVTSRTLDQHWGGVRWAKQIMSVKN